MAFPCIFRILRQCWWSCLRTQCSSWHCVRAEQPFINVPIQGYWLPVMPACPPRTWISLIVERASIEKMQMRDSSRVDTVGDIIIWPKCMMTCLQIYVFEYNPVSHRKIFSFGKFVFFCTWLLKWNHFGNSGINVLNQSMLLRKK